MSSSSELFYPYAPQPSGSAAPSPFDTTIQKATPGVVLLGTEASAQYHEVREVAGDLWIVKNALWNTNTSTWQQASPCNTTLPAYAQVLKANGDILHYWVAATNNPAANITWTAMQSLLGTGRVTFTPQTDTATGVDFYINPTWNPGSGASMAALRINVVDTASNATSLFYDAQIGGVSKWSVQKDGTMFAGSNFFGPTNALVSGSVTVGSLILNGTTATTANILNDGTNLLYRAYKVGSAHFFQDAGGTVYGSIASTGLTTGGSSYGGNASVAGTLNTGGIATLAGVVSTANLGGGASNLIAGGSFSAGLGINGSNGQGEPTIVAPYTGTLALSIWKWNGSSYGQVFNINSAGQPTGGAYNANNDNTGVVPANVSFGSNGTQMVLRGGSSILNATFLTNTGAGLPLFAASFQGNGVVATGVMNVNQQGGWLQWNRGGSGTTFLVNQKGLGTGGISFGHSDTSNNYTQDASLDESGNFNAATSLAAAGIHVPKGYNGSGADLGSAARLYANAQVACTFPGSSLYSSVVTYTFPTAFSSVPSVVITPIDTVQTFVITGVVITAISASAVSFRVSAAASPTAGYSTPVNILVIGA